MKYVDEFRDPLAARGLLREIEASVFRLGASQAKPLQVMEVCGGHTHSIFRYALKDLIPPALEFVHGPGCPVCVLPMGRVDDCIASPKVVKITSGCWAMAMQSSTRPIGSTQTGQPGPCTNSSAGGIRSLSA